MSDVEVSQLTKVGKHLTSILKLAGDLEDQAEHKANDHDYLPGGDAMVALAGVASPEAWENVFAAAEAWNADPSNRVKRPVDHIADEDDNDAPPLQTVLYWSEQWRVQLNRESDRRPTLTSEVGFIRQALEWAHENDPAFDAFVVDMGKAKRRLEDLLYAGTRIERGVPCLYAECFGARLVRSIDHRGERSDWKCRKCNRVWDDDHYWQHVKAANERAQVEVIGPEVWCTVDYAARDLGRSVKTIRTWVNRGKLSTVCIIAGRRIRFVNLDEARVLDADKSNRRMTAA